MSRKFRLIFYFSLFFFFLSGFGLGTGWAQEASLVVQWDPNIESDLAGYRVYWGTVSRQYSKQIDVGNVNRYRITHLEAGKTYFIAVTAYDNWNNESDFSQEVSGKAAVHFQSAVSPKVFVLFQNYPNPFNPTTTIRYSVPSPATVRLSIFDHRGRLVQTLHNGHDEAGLHSFLWNGRNLRGEDVASGTYFVRLRAGGFSLSQKLLLIR